MPVPSSLADLSTTAASNSPAGSDSIGTSLDDYLRSIQAILKQGVSKGSDIASASTITPVATSSYFVVTGTTSITAIGETYSWAGRVVVLKFDGVLTLTHSASLILPGAASITTAAGDVGTFVNESTGIWRCVFFQKASGEAIAFIPSTTLITGQTEDLTPDTSTDYLLTYDASAASLKKVKLNKVGGAGGNGVGGSIYLAANFGGF